MHRYHVRSFDDPTEFARVAEPYLLAHEATHCLQLGLISSIVAGEWQDPFMATVTRDEEVALVALRTPPHNLLLSRSPDDHVLEPLLAELQRREAQAWPGGVLGPAQVAGAFASRWASSKGAIGRLEKRLRIYRLERVQPTAGVAGDSRPAGNDDRRLLEEWMAGFLSEALPEQRSDPVELVERWLTSPDRELWLWEDGGKAVALAGAGSPTRNGVRISAVYTPPHSRRRGYASALVANVSQRQLDAGRRFCFLFTDLDNPTSNRIYQQVGYLPVSDFHEHRFEDP